MHGLTHLVVPVLNLTASAQFYERALQFVVSAETEDWVDLETGGTTLRLVPNRGTESAAVGLRLSTGEVEEDHRSLLAAGATEIHAPHLSADSQTFEAELQDPAGNRLTLWRPLAESEMDEPPALPTTRLWKRGAEQLLQELVLHVPESFRDLARRASVERAEDLAGSDDVDVQHAVQGHVHATPAFAHDRLRESLQASGFDLDAFLPQGDGS